MKKTALGLMLMTLVIMAHGQTNSSTRNPGTDSDAIKVTCLNYIEGYYHADAQRMAKAIDPELAKRIIFKDQAGDAVQGMGYSTLLLNTRRNKNTNILNPGEPFKATVSIFDIGENIATVKVTTNTFKFMDYLQLGRINGEWKIVNVLWEYISK